jgi:glycosyltransferase involved in cell wall biosynthesis
VAAATGDWVVLLDSDDELLPGALQRIAHLTQRATGVERLVFMYRLDTGGVSPEPTLIDEVWDFDRYVRFAATAKRGEFLNVVRRSAFDRVRYPENRALESLFHFDFAREFRTHSHPEIVGVLHSDATDRSLVPTAPRGQSANIRRNQAIDQAETLNILVRKHGERLSQIAPGLHRNVLRGVATSYFLGGHRAKGTQAVLAFLKNGGRAAEAAAILVLGLAGPDILWTARNQARRRALIADRPAL